MLGRAKGHASYQVIPVTDASNPDQADTDAQLLQQEIDRLRQDNESLSKRLESIEGAVVAAFEQKITDLGAGESKKVFENYHSVLVNNYTDAVIKKLFDSGDFVSQMLQAVWQNLRNWRGVVSLIGISGLGAIGVLTLINQMNNYVLSKADQVFEKQIDAKAPEMLERLERDRETIMLLTLDISAQDQVHLPTRGLSDLGIDPVREAYLENNSDYEKILVDFLKGDSNSPLQAKIVRANSRNKAILRYYALNYILQVNPDNDFKEALLAVLKDENIELNDAEAGADSETSFINRLDVRNQILAIRALRRYKNQMNRLAKEVLLNGDYDYLYKNSTFWQGLLNEFIFTSLEEPFDADIVQEFLTSAWFEDENHRGEIASTMLMMFTLYPDLCGESDEDCTRQISPLIANVQTMLQQRDITGPDKSAGLAEDAATDMDGEIAEQINDPFSCPQYLTPETMTELLSYRRGLTTPASGAALTDMLGVFDCLLGLYHRDWRNFSFYQDPVLFYGDSASTPRTGLAVLFNDYMSLYWQGVERGYLGGTEDATSLSLDQALSFYSRLQEVEQPQEASVFYSKLLSDSATAYESWIAEDLYRRVSSSKITQQAFSQWLRYQGYSAEAIQDVAAIDIRGFVDSIVWSSHRQRYLSSVEYSVSAEELAAGRGIDLFLLIMASGYYPEDIWVAEIFPLFDAYWDAVVDYDRNHSNYLWFEEGQAPPPVSGTSAEQDALWQWINDQHGQGRLVFAPEHQQWQLEEPSPSE